MQFRQFFLLVMLIMTVWSAPDREITLCDSSMICFVPDLCVPRSTISAGKIKVHSQNQVSPKCEVIFKIRSYNTMHSLIVLESFIPAVTWITLKQESATFTCETQGSAFKAIYNEKEQTLINKIEPNQPLVCEFYVKADAEIFALSGSGSVTLSYGSATPSDVKTFKITEQLFRPNIPITCDPDKEGIKQTEEGKIYADFDGKFEKLKCPNGYKTMFRQNSASNFVEASEIICKDKLDVYRYEATPITSSSPIRFESTSSAHCEATICELCETNITPSNIKYLSIKTEPDGCKKLECDGGRRIKIGDSQAKDGSAQCDYEENRKKSVWKFDEEVITKDTTIFCAEKCKEDAARKWCPECYVDDNNIPKCKRNTTLKFRTSGVEVFCDDITGKHYFLEKGDTMKYTNENLEGETLTCEDKSSTSSQVDSASFDPKIIAYIVVPIVVLVLIGVGAYFVMKKNQNNGLPPVGTEKMKEGPTNSKESVKSVTALESGKIDESQKKEEDGKPTLEQVELAITMAQTSMNGVEKRDDNTGMMTAGGTFHSFTELAQKDNESVRRQSKKGKGTKTVTKKGTEKAAEKATNDVQPGIVDWDNDNAGPLPPHLLVRPSHH